MEQASFNVCNHETFHCTNYFIERMMTHPCRTSTIDAQTRAVAVLHTLPRVATGNQDTVDQESHQFFNWTLALLRKMPREVREHEHLYMFAGGEAFLMGQYDFDSAFPSHATVFIPEPLWAQQHPYGQEPAVPQTFDACYLYRPSARYVSVPYYQPSNDTMKDYVRDSSRDERPHRVFYYGGTHGQATLLRRRLYELCDALGDSQDDTATWYCPRDLTAPTGGSLHGVQPLTEEQYVQAMGLSTFSLIPAGDTPGRITTWDCLRRGCVPVLFSSCPTTHSLWSHAGFLPADDGNGFGVRKWAVLLNQTAVMTNSTYLSAELNAISDAQIREMRAAVRPYLSRMRYDLAVSDDDALAHTVKHMLYRWRGAPSGHSGFPQTFSTVCLDCAPPFLRLTDPDELTQMSEAIA